MISSAQNPKLKLVRALINQAKTRRQEGFVVLEGVRLLQDVVAQGFLPEFIVHLPDHDVTWLSPAIQCLPVEARLFQELSDTEHSQGILGVFPQAHLELPTAAGLVVALEGLQDAGNVGTIIRTCAAAGVDGVILLPHTVDVYNPKCVRAGMGAHFRLPLLHLTLDEFLAQFGDWQRVGAVVDADAQAYTNEVWNRPTVLIIGNEAHGLSEGIRPHLTQSVFIPMQNGVESLNSSVATAILVFEIIRQLKG